MDKSLNELKIQAKKLFKCSKKDDVNALARLAKCYRSNQPTTDSLQLKHCQLVLAKELGFQDWQHLQKILSGAIGNKSAEVDMGSIFYVSACSALLNQWFTTYDEAKAALDAKHYLLPYKKQFVVVSVEHIKTLGITDIDLGHGEHNDVYAIYPGLAWDNLVLQIVKKR
jgi:hypothetical protein